MPYSDKDKERAFQRAWYHRNKQKRAETRRKNKKRVQAWINISQANGSWSRGRLEAEIAKCDVLCANCHQKLHWEEKQSKPND